LIQHKIINKAVTFIVNSIYPLACPICSRPTDKKLHIDFPTWQEYGDVCSDCTDKVKPIDEAQCMKCGKILNDNDSEYCYDCKYIRHEYTQCIAALPYEGQIKQSIYRFKYKGCREYAWWYANIIEKYCGERIRIWSPDIIIPVPMYHAKEKVRGYNQTELIAQNLSKLLDVDMNAQLLFRIKKTAPMKKLHAIERIKNLENAFLVKRKMIKYNKVLLLDDIYTTGATLDACAKALKRQGVKEVYGVCLCIGRGFS